MSDQVSLLLAILNSPDDQTLRLVYADWLEEHGDPRAELVRLECQLTALAEDHPARLDLEAREAGLVEQYGQSWFGPLLRVLGPGFPVRHAGIAWLLFLHSGLPGPGSDPLQAATTWKGQVEQNSRIFPTRMQVRRREGNFITGEMRCQFESGAGEWTYEGVVMGPHVAYVTDRKSGSVTYPGLYLGRLDGVKFTGRWRVPSFSQEGDFRLTRKNR
jgi:uncharacterized protein (TIGR02996 family)